MAGPYSLDGLMKWLRREEWADAFDDLLARHLGPACAKENIEDLDHLISVTGMDDFMVLWGCAFEDFLAHDLEDGRNIVDDYLKRRGWKEKVQDKAYMAALRSSVMSLYEVSDIVPGSSFLARDLVRGGDPVRVSEKSGSRSLRQWDKISARVVKVSGTTMLTGGLLRFDLGDADALMASIEKFRKGERKEIAKLTSGLPDEAADALAEGMSSESALLRGLAPLFTTVWLGSYLSRVLDPKRPDMVNTDGDTLQFTTLHYPLGPGVTGDDVRAALRGVPALREESPTFWNWVESNRPIKPTSTRAPASRTFITALDDGALCLGTVELAADKITLSVNSQKRAERGRAVLADALAGLTLEPLAEMQTVEQLLASKPARETPLPPSGLSPDEEKAVIRASLDEHYRRLLDEPVPALGDVTPRRAARTKKGREKLIAWLKYLENESGKHAADSPMAGYELAWMWEELGVADQRR